MAYIPTRIRVEFTSMQGICHGLLICDSDYIGPILDFTTTEEGYTLDYENQNGEIYQGLHGSSCTVNLRVEESNETSFQVFLTDLIGAQEDEFFIKILKGQNTSEVPADIWDEFYYEVYEDGTWTGSDMSCSGMESEWKGQVVQDLIEYQDLPNPYTFKIVANDALTKLKGIETTGTTQRSVLEQIIDIMAETGLNDLWGANEPFIETCVRWYETQMNGGTTVGTDPVAFTRFEPGEVFYTTKDNGETEYFDLFERFQKNLVELWGARFFQSKGRWWLVQNDQLPSGTVTTFVYSKNYAATDPRTPTAGELEVDKSTDLNLTVVKNSNSKTSPTPLTGNVYRFFPALQGARLTFDFLASAVIYDRTQEDITSTTTLGTVTTGTNLSLLFDLNHLVAYSSIPTSVLTQAYLRSDFTITIVNGGTTYYWTNTGAIAQWQTTSGVFRVEDTIVLQGGSGSSSLATVFNTGLIPQSGTLRISVSTTLIGKGTGTSYTANIDTERTDLKVSYYDQVDVIDGSIIYDSSNANATSSSVIADLGTMNVGDLAASPEKNKLQVYNTSWVDSVNWQREGAGTNYAIHALRVFEVAALQRSPFREYRGTIKYGGVGFHNLITYESIIYANTGGRYEARFEEWSASWFQVGRVTTGITTIDARDNVGLGLSAVLVRAPQPEETIDAGLGDAFKVTGLTGTASGTITSISVNALSSATKTIRQGDVITLINPNNGSEQELTVSADANAGATSISVNSQALSESFPAGTLVAFTGDNALQKMGEPDVESTSASGTLTDSLAAYKLIRNASVLRDGYYRIVATIQLDCLTNDTIDLRLHDGTVYLYYGSDFTIVGLSDEDYPFSITTGTLYLTTTDDVRFEYRNNEDWDYTNAALVLVSAY